MAINLPTIPLGASTALKLLSSATDLRPYLGGPVQRVSRLGDRWRLDVQCRPMKFAQAMWFCASLIQGLSEKVVCAIPQPGLDLTGISDTTAVAAGSGGKTLVVAGGGTKIVGQYLSLVSGGVRYLHMVTAVAGNTLSIYPMLKVPIAGGETVELLSPKIEGFLDGNEQGWTLGLVENIGLTFVIVEAQ